MYKTIIVNIFSGPIFEPDREEVTGGWKIYNEELHDLYSSLSTGVVKRRGLRWRNK
jgi:hypothetical protein